MMQFWADPSFEGKAKHSIDRERARGAVGSGLISHSLLNRLVVLDKKQQSSGGKQNYLIQSPISNRHLVFGHI